MKKHLGALSVFFSAVFWGTAGIFVSTLRGLGVSGIGIVFARAVFASALLIIYLLIFDRNAFRIKLSDLWLFALTGIASIVFFNFCYYKTMDLMGLSVAAVLMYTAPIFVMIISVLFLGEKLNAVKILSCIFAVLGCAFVSGVLDTETSINSKGIIFGLMTGFGYSLYGIFSTVLINRGYKPLTITFYAFIFAILGSAVCVGKNLPSVFHTFTSTPKPVITIFLMALINTIIPYILYSTGLKSVKPTVAIIIATVEPVVATLFDMAVYGKFPSVYGYLGIIIILFAVLSLNLFGQGDNKNNDTDGKCKNQSNT